MQIEAALKLPSLSQQAAQYREDISYTSKLDEFEMFVSRAKYPSLGLVAPSQPLPRQQPQKEDSQQQQQQQQCRDGTGHLASQVRPSPAPPRTKLLLIDDLPHASDADARRRLSAALRDLVLTARGPIMLVTTTEPSSSSNGVMSGSSAASGSAKGLHKDILAVLTAVGSIVVAFNPVVTTGMSKASLASQIHT